MALLRLFILAVLIYLLFYLIFGSKKNKKITKEPNTDGEQSSSVNDVLIEDPICHKLVPKGQAVRLRHDGKIIYFCGEECCEIYEKNQKEKG